MAMLTNAMRITTVHVAVFDPRTSSVHRDAPAAACLAGLGARGQRRLRLLQAVRAADTGSQERAAL